MRIEHRVAKVVGILLFVAACAVIFGFLFKAAGGSLPGDGGAYRARVQLPDAFQLVENSDVRRAGVTIGKVADVTNRGDHGLVELEVDHDQGPIYRDATVKLRTKTLVGENYVELDPGTARAGRLEPDGTLPLAQAGEAVNLDQILSGLDAPTRQAVRRNLDALGEGLRDRGGALNRFFAEAAPMVQKAGALTDVLDGQRRQLGRVVDDTGAVMQALADRTADVRRLAVEAKSTADAAASRDRQLAAVLSELPPTLAQIRSTSTHLGGVARRTTPVVADLRATSSALVPVTRRLASASRQGQRLFRALPGFSERAEPMLASLRRFSGPTTKIVPALDGFLRQFTPMLDYLAPRAGQIASAFAVDGSAVSATDATGRLVRFNFVFDDRSIQGLPEPLAETLSSALKGGSRNPSFGINAYPDARDARAPRAFTGPPPRVDADPSALDR